MSRRNAIVAAVMLFASTLGGCASTSWLWGAMSGEGLAPATGYPWATAENLEPARVAMMPEDAEATGRPLKQQGYVVEDRSARQGPYKLDTGDKLRVFVYGQPNLSRLYNVDQSGSI